MVAYRCFDCGRDVPENLVRRRVRCPYCGGKILYKPRLRITRVKAVYNLYSSFSLSFSHSSLSPSFLIISTRYSSRLLPVFSPFPFPSWMRRVKKEYE